MSMRTHICECQNGFGGPSCAIAPCPAGHTGTPGKCIPCAKGFWKSEPGEAACNACGKDETTQTTRATKPSECGCKPGYTQQRTGMFGSSCEACPKDTYKDTVGPAACSMCATGSDTNSKTAQTKVTSMMDAPQLFWQINCCSLSSSCTWWW